MTSPPPSLDTLHLLMSQDRTNRYCTISTIAFLAWDILINFPQEYKFVWRTRWGAVKVLYFVSRYWSLAWLVFSFGIHLNPRPTHALCKADMFIMTLVSDISFTTTINAILALRVNALYAHNRKVLVILIFLVIMEFTMEMATDLQWVLRSGVFTPTPGIPWQACLLLTPNARLTLVSWIPCLIVALTFFIMTLYKFFTVSWRNGTHYSLRHSGSLLYVFVKDGTVYFFLTFCIVLINCVFVVNPSTSYLSSGPGDWLIAIYSLAGSRLILNLRAAAVDGKLNFTSTTGEETEVSAFRVAPGIGSTTYINSEIELRSYHS